MGYNTSYILIIYILLRYMLIDFGINLVKLSIVWLMTNSNPFISEQRQYILITNTYGHEKYEDFDF